MKDTDVAAFFEDLDAGIFAQKIGRALSEVAAGVVDNGKAGKVTITFNLKQIGSSHQVAVDHTLTYTKPTNKGKLTEENTTTTPMHVGSGGALSFFAENQNQLFSKKGEPV